MKRASKAIVVVLVVGLLAFFLFAPVWYWYAYPWGMIGCVRSESQGSDCPAVARQFISPVYRSLGCWAVGFGDQFVAGPYPSARAGIWFWTGFHLGCASIPL